MKIQCSPIQRALKSTLEFVYFDAPFPRSAGPGILPGFKDDGPFKTWFKTGEEGKELSDGSGYDYYEHDGIERVLKMMKAKGEAHEWVGVLGFSQGTRVAGGLLLNQQRRVEAGEKMELDLKFGVLCMGGAAPMQSKSLHGSCRDVERKEALLTLLCVGSLEEIYGISSTTELDTEERIFVPTLHLHGLKDVNLNNGRKQLAMFYEPGTTRLLEINYHHAMPWEKSDVAQFSEMLKTLYDNVR